jgi:phosphoglycolate phosphatase
MIFNEGRYLELTGVEYKKKRIPCRLVIFDKDGTLIDFSATWVPLIRKRVAFLLKTLGRDGELEAFLLKSWGIDPISGRIDPRGPCPVSPRSDEIIIGTMALYQHGYPWDESKVWVSQAFDHADSITDRKKMLKPVDDIQKILSHLKSKGFSLALATSDERRDTKTMLSSLDMEGLFDIVLCAGDVHPPKPHPETVFAICRQLSIPPQEAIFLGDTVTDMIMGKRAGLALTVGIIEGGVTPREELEKVADIVVDSIRDLKFF